MSEETTETVKVGVRRVRADMRRPDLTEGLFQSSLIGCKLNRAHMAGAGFEHVDFSASTLDRADMQRAVFKSCNFEGVSMKHAKMQRSSFIDCNFGGTSFDGAIMINANLYRSNLYNISLRGADIYGTLLPPNFIHLGIGTDGAEVHAYKQDDRIMIMGEGFLQSADDIRKHEKEDVPPSLLARISCAEAIFKARVDDPDETGDGPAEFGPADEADADMIPEVIEVSIPTGDGADTKAVEWNPGKMPEWEKDQKADPQAR